MLYLIIVLDGGFMGLANSSQMNESLDLLRVVAEEIKRPLIEIARSSELVSLTDQSALETVIATVETSANTALDLIDSYLLGLQLAGQQQFLQLEPISIGSVLYDTAHDLEKFAQVYNAKVQLSFKKTQRSVMAHGNGLHAALVNMGRVIIESQAEHNPPAVINLGLHNYAGLIVAGIYSDMEPIAPAYLRAACKLYSRTRQPFRQLSSSSAAGIFIAHNILQAMSVRLRTARYNKQAGLAITLQPSYQMQLV
ncbi:MAG: hypothetical protein ABSB12_00450 [Candidatus Saccharimonadales bacterium]